MVPFLSIQSDSSIFRVSSNCVTTSFSCFHVPDISLQQVAESWRHCKDRLGMPHRRSPFGTYYRNLAHLEDQL